MNRYQQCDQNSISSGCATPILMALANLAATILRDAKILAFPYEYIVTIGLALLIGYWIPPRATYSFRQFVFRILVLVTALHACLWVLPKLLDSFLWTPAAYAIPAFALMISLYWIRPLDPTNTKRSKFWIWAVTAAALSIIYAWASLNHNISELTKGSESLNQLQLTIFVSFVPLWLSFLSDSKDSSEVSL